jgi:hypothetical protein
MFWKYRGRTVSFLGIHKSKPNNYIGFSPALHLQCVTEALSTAGLAGQPKRQPVNTTAATAAPGGFQQHPIFRGESNHPEYRVQPQGTDTAVEATAATTARRSTALSVGTEPTPGHQPRNYLEE